MKYLPISKKNVGHIGNLVIDDQDYEDIRQFNWMVSKDGYAQRSRSKHEAGKVELLHRRIMDINDPTIFVDHKNENKLDNRRGNLRLSNKQQNGRNISKVSPKHNNPHRGISWHKETETWRAYITVNNKQIYLGLHDLLDGAIKARQAAEKFYFGEFAPNRMEAL